MHRFLLPCILLLSPLSAFATVGGEQHIELLGYDTQDQKVYVLRHYEDGRARLPQLYYFDLRSKQNDKLIEVTSIYIDPKTGKADYDNNDVAFNKELHKIKRRLSSLYPLNPKVFSVQINQQQQESIPSWHDPNEEAIEYHYEYHVHDSSYQSQPQKAISYKPELKIKKAFRIPRQNKILVTIEYLGIPFESGYNMEDPILLSPKTK
ncbi:hypothetical protein GCM10023206_13580 [Acinetobacter puyangensis]|uniref:Aminotransferase n=1 Tax=Acinetobacter puyangensis TaxID=1096779 RepID=A0A240E9L5_9GAMM|nr:aminotransferase [Acinetobacter puyangensis]SNX44923.1 hypothetical protein SAMN05421731_104288 [Acinetobacter puyangensis]